MPTQRERLIELIGGLDTEKTRDLASRVGTVVAEAQNRPPQGGADGSLDTGAWEACRDAGSALHDLASALERAQKKLARLMVKSP
jgi:hypothetical protein